MKRLVYLSRLVILLTVTLGPVGGAIAQTSTFNYTGSVQYYTVPADVSHLSIDAYGAAGGVAGPVAALPASGTPAITFGGRVQGLLAVTPGQVLNIYVGGQGDTGIATGVSGGYNGGGDAAGWFGLYSGGSGGGCSDIRIGGNAFPANTVFVAGGGAGGGYNNFYYQGGNGGGLTGADGTSDPGGTAGTGGSQVAGGVGGGFPTYTYGTNGTQPTGGSSQEPAPGIGGGGGGGYWGGGGGGWSGGGGGSSYTDATLVTAVIHTQGYAGATGNGLVSITTDFVPFFVNGAVTSIPNVCQNAVSYDFTALMVIDDSDAGQTETWSVIYGPSNGSLSGFPATESSNGGVLTPPDMTYTPTGGYSGPDSFAVQVNDGLGGADTMTVYVTVNALPVLTSSLTPPNTCDSAVFNYTPASVPAGTYAWSRAAVAGISTPASSGTGNISEALVDTTSFTVPVVYVYTLTANGCSDTQSVTDTVVPMLLLNSTLAPTAICSGTVFSYTASSATPGTSFIWNRNPVVGISNSGVVGSTENPVTETLNDTTALPVAVTYTYNIIYGACLNTESVVVTVNPIPTLSSAATDTICDSTLFTYVPMSATPGTRFTWSRAAIAGISDTANSGVDTASEILVDTFSYPVATFYVDTLTANGCTNTDTVTVTVNPRATLSSTITPAAICDSTLFSYKPTFTTADTVTSFAWSREPATGISGGPTSGIDTISEVLHNSTTAPVVVTFSDTLTAYGCKNIENVMVTVNPTPKLNSSLTPPAICDSIPPFNYTPTSATLGAAFSWRRPYVPGIDEDSSSGTGNPAEQLINTTNDNVTVVYVYTVTANGCSYSPDIVTVVVHPTPTLSSPLTETICSGVPFNYTPTSNTPKPQVSFSWTRGITSGITPSAGTDTGSIHETITNTTSGAVSTQYVYTLIIDGDSACAHREDVTLTVNPGTAKPVITIMPPASLCSNTNYMNFGAATTPPTGTNYTWSAINGNVWATGSTRQYSIVSFDNPGSAWVVLTSSIGSTACKNTDSFAVTVGTSVSQNPPVVFYNGQFMCLDNNVGSYQWGYDDATTLDSTLIPGEVNQVYFNSTPDLIHKYYWLMTTSSADSGCLQKTYYNTPTGITNINAEVASIKVYPNPATDNINVEINTTIGGNMQVEVLNLLGQRLNTTPATDNKATINISALPAGVYLINCTRDGVKIGTAKFIKN